MTSIHQPINGEVYDRYLDQDLDAYYGDDEDEQDDALGMGPDEGDDRGPVYSGTPGMNEP
jgi:hypothetical protein